MDTGRMREVMKRRKEADANKAAGEGTFVPRPPPPPLPPKRSQPVTTVPPPARPTKKRPRTENEQGSADHHRSSSPTSRVLPGTVSFRVEDAKSLRVAMNSAMSLLRSTKIFSDLVSKKAKDFSDLEVEYDKMQDSLRETQAARKKVEGEKKELEEVLARKDVDLKGAEASRDLVGLELNRVSKKYARFRVDVAVKIEDLEFQQASAFVRGYDTALSHVKFRAPDFDFTNLCWDTELKDGRLIPAEEATIVNYIENTVGTETPGGQEVQQEVQGRNEGT